VAVVVFVVSVRVVVVVLERPHPAASAAARSSGTSHDRCRIRIPAIIGSVVFASSSLSQVVAGWSPKAVIAQYVATLLIRWMVSRR